MNPEAPSPDPLRILSVGNDSALQLLYEEAFGGGGNAAADGDGSGFDLHFCRMSADAAARIRKSGVENRPYAMAFLNLASRNGPDGISLCEQIRGLDERIHLVIVASPEAMDLSPLLRKVPPADKLFVVQPPIQVPMIRQLAEALGTKWRSEGLLRRTHVALEQKVAELERSRQELVYHKDELETVNNQLLETNDALSVLARNLENARRESEKQVLRKTRTLILPVVEKLRQDRRLDRYRTDLDLLSGYVRTLTADISDKTRNAEVLSATESRIAAMIRLGLTSEEIADHLSVSVSTVKTHRKNIRRKLQLKNTGKNLRSYLESRFASE